MTIRTAFVERFGEEEAQRIEAAAEYHYSSHDPILGGWIGGNRGSDPFKWVLLAAISFQCMEIALYRQYHDIVTPWDDLKAWIKKHADLGSHDGDSDTLGLLAGIYNEYVLGGEQGTDRG